uniref:Uncharacterized protein n=1 Tax=Phycomyces blakesleeanus TaxID=4837 RepID=A0A0K1HNK7_PHYBL|nr:hypothetical protein [Phycomyces blakesleeanus]AKT93750.1 hypothetical protein [Phycomyces blakesleeanus]
MVPIEGASGVDPLTWKKESFLSKFYVPRELRSRGPCPPRLSRGGNENYMLPDWVEMSTASSFSYDKLSKWLTLCKPASKKQTRAVHGNVPSHWESPPGALLGRVKAWVVFIISPGVIIGFTPPPLTQPFIYHSRVIPV